MHDTANIRLYGYIHTNLDKQTNKQTQIKNLTPVLSLVWRDADAPDCQHAPTPNAHAHEP